VWLYFRFPLSLRIVEDMLAARGIIVSHQTVRLWAEKFGRAFAGKIRGCSAGSGAPSIRTVSSWDFGAKPLQRQGGKASDAQAVEGPRPNAARESRRGRPTP
jgi:hypothetical protein